MCSEPKSSPTPPSGFCVPRGDGTPITLQESLRGLFYASYYPALALGAYLHEGLAIRFASTPEPTVAPAGLFDGTVDVAWGGRMRVMQTYYSRPDCDFVCFGEAVTRDPFPR